MNLIITADEQACKWMCCLNEEIDLFKAPELKAEIGRLLDEHEWDIELDLAGMGYIDSAGIGVLIGALKRVKSCGKSFTLKNVRPEVLNIFKITRLDMVFDIK